MLYELIPFTVNTRGSLKPCGCQDNEICLFSCHICCLSYRFVLSFFCIILCFVSVKAVKTAFFVESYRLSCSMKFTHSSCAERKHTCDTQKCFKTIIGWVQVAVYTPVPLNHTKTERLLEYCTPSDTGGFWSVVMKAQRLMAGCSFDFISFGVGTSVACSSHPSVNTRQWTDGIRACGALTHANELMADAHMVRRKLLEQWYIQHSSRNGVESSSDNPTRAQIARIEGSIQPTGSPSQETS